jgi:deazaflavin-dependent oxidoreductase (nitroreductase family)
MALERAHLRAREPEGEMLGSLLVAAVVLVGVVVVLGVLFVLGMRAKCPFVLGMVIWLSRRFANPSAMRTAGRPGDSVSIVRHRGRRSGKEYQTPIGAVPIEGGFVIALPYGMRASWLRNVLAAGSATIVHEGRAYRVDRPEVVPMRDYASAFSASDRRGFRLLGVGQCLRVRTGD